MNDTTRNGQILQLAARLEEMAHAHSAAAASTLNDHGVSGTSAGLIWTLGTADTALSMSQLAERLFCDPSNVTLLAEQLERLGLAERIPDPHDGRRRILRLTAEGRAAWDATRLAVLQASPLSALDDRSLAALCAMLLASEH